MSEISIGDYLIEETQSGDLVFTEVSTGKTLTIDGDEITAAISSGTLSSALDANNNSINNADDLDGARLVAEKLTQQVAEETSHIKPQQPKPITTTQDRTIYVDPSGDDTIATENISSSNPLETLQEALDRTPLIIQHNWKISLADGTYSTQNSIVGPAVILGGFAHSGGDDPIFTIVGNRSNPTNVDIDATNFSLHVHQPEWTDTPGFVDSLRFRGGIQNKGGIMSFEQVVFSGENKAYAFIGKGPGHSRFDNCEFQNNLTDAIRCVSGEKVVAVRNDIDVQRNAFTATNGSTIKAFDNPTVKSGENVFEQDTTGELYEQSGQRWTGDHFWADDWGDGRFENHRVRTADAAYRPTWNVVSGNPSVQNNKLELPAGDTTTQQVNIGVQDFGAGDWVYGEWVANFEFQSDPTASNVFWQFIYGGSSDRYEVRLRNDGVIELRKNGGSGITSILSGNYTPTNDTKVRVTRSDADEWELFVDGTSQGTVTDSFTPSPNRGHYIQNTSDAALRVNSLLVR